MRQIGRQVPRRFVRQPLGICGEHHRSPLPLGTVGTHVHLQRPPRLFVAIPEVAYNLHPLSGVSLSLPILASRHSRLKRGAYLAFLVPPGVRRSEEHTSELQSRGHLVCRLLLEKKKTI